MSVKPDGLRRPLWWDWGLLLVIAWPFALLINRAWLFSRPINQTEVLADAWIYWGYFHNYRTYSQILPTHYFHERLSWILPGMAAYRIFPPLIANTVLHLGVYLLAAVSLYVAIKQAFGRKTALITILIIGSYTGFLQSVGWDYLDGISNAYLSLLIAMLVLAQTDARWRLWLIGAGAALVLVITTQISWALPAALIGVGYLAADRIGVKRPFRQSAACVVIGVAVMGGAITLIYYALTHRWWILGNSLRWAAENGNQPELRQIVFEGYPPPYPFLAIPTLIFFASVIYLISMIGARVGTEFRHTLPLRIMWSALYVLHGLQMVASHVFTGYPVLVMIMYVSQVLPLMAMALAALIAPTLEALDARAFRRVLVVGIVALLLPCVATAVIDYAALNRGVALIWPLALGAVGAVVFALKRLPLVARISAALVLISAANYLTSPSMFDEGNSPAARESFLAVNEVFLLMRERYPQSDALVWMSDDDHYDVYKAIASANLWGWQRTLCCIPEPHDIVSKQGADMLLPPHIVLLGADPDTFAIGSAAYTARYGCDLILTEQVEVAHGEIRFTAWFVDLEPACLPDY